MSAQPATTTRGDSPTKAEFQSRSRPESLKNPSTATPHEIDHSIESMNVDQLSERIAVFDANNHLHHILITSRAATAATLRRMISGHLEPSQAQEIVSIIESVNQRAFSLFERAKALSKSASIETLIAAPNLQLDRQPDQNNDSEFACFSVAPQKD